VVPAATERSLCGILSGSAGPVGHGENAQDGSGALGRTPRECALRQTFSRFKQEEYRVRPTQADLENVSANPAVHLFSVGDGQIDGTSSVAESGDRNGVGSMEQGG